MAEPLFLHSAYPVQSSIACLPVSHDSPGGTATGATATAAVAGTASAAAVTVTAAPRAGAAG